MTHTHLWAHDPRSAQDGSTSSEKCTPAQSLIRLGSDKNNKSNIDQLKGGKCQPDSTTEVYDDSNPNWRGNQDCSRGRPGMMASFNAMLKKWYLAFIQFLFFLQPPTWAQRLFKEDEEGKGDKIMTKPSQPTFSKTAFSETCSTIPLIPSCAFPNNSMAATLQKHDQIPGLFTTTLKKSNRHTKRNQEGILGTGSEIKQVYFLLKIFFSST